MSANDGEAMRELSSPKHSAEVRDANDGSVTLADLKSLKRYEEIFTDQLGRVAFWVSMAEGNAMLVAALLDRGVDGWSLFLVRTMQTRLVFLERGRGNQSSPTTT